MRKRIFEFVLLLLCFCFSPAGFAETLQFAQVSDIHYSNENEYLSKYLYFLSLSLKKENPEFVVFLGDNVDKSREIDVIKLMQALHPVKIPYYIALGKNDAHQLRGLEKETYLEIVSAFNKRQQKNKSYYFFKPNKDFICVVLDDNPNFAPSKHGEITDEQFIWLENLLIKNPKKYFLIFHHAPVVPPREEYKLSMLNSDKYFELLEKYNNIISVSAGHYHQEGLKIDKNGVYHISAPAFLNKPHSYQLIKIIYDKKKMNSPKDVKVEIKTINV